MCAGTRTADAMDARPDEGMEGGVFRPVWRKIRRIRAGSGPYALSPDLGRTRIKNSKEGCRIHVVRIVPDEGEDVGKGSETYRADEDSAG